MPARQLKFGEPVSLPVACKISLDAVRCHFGGLRWVVRCPGTTTGNPCGRRAGKLYLVNRRWVCRSCGDLTYLACQQHDRRLDALARSPESLLEALESQDFRKQLLALKAVPRAYQVSPRTSCWPARFHPILRRRSRCAPVERIINLVQLVLFQRCGFEERPSLYASREPHEQPPLIAPINWRERVPLLVHRIEIEKPSKLAHGKSMSIFKRGRTYWFPFWFDGAHIQRSTKQRNP